MSMRIDDAIGLGIIWLRSRHKLCLTGVQGILGNAEMCAHGIVIIGMGGEETSKTCLTKDNKMVKAFSPDRVDDSFH